jgi:hypothetical protein
MRTRCHKLEVGIICFAIMAFGCDAQAQNLTTRTTGCLGSDGNFSAFALGDAPLAGCPAGQIQVSLKLDDLSDGAATVPFFVTLRFGEEQIIAQNGALELRARCILGSGTSGDSVALVVRSTLDGWLATSAGRSTTTANRAQDEIILFTAAGRPGQGRLSGFGDERLTGAQLALAPDGSFLALAPGSTALGVDLLDQDCLAVGTASLIRGVLPPSPGIGQPLQGVSPGISGAIAPGNQIVGAVDGNGISVGVTIGNPIAGTPATGMSPISGGIAPPLGGGISSIGGPTPLSDGGIPSLGGGISSIGGPTPLSDGGIPSLGGGISSIGGPTPLSDGGIPSLGGGISSIGGPTPLSDGGIPSLGGGISSIGR